MNIIAGYLCVENGTPSLQVQHHVLQRLSQEGKYVYTKVIQDIFPIKNLSSTRPGHHTILAMPSGSTLAIASMSVLGSLPKALKLLSILNQKGITILVGDLHRSKDPPPYKKVFFDLLEIKQKKDFVLEPYFKAYIELEKQLDSCFSNQQKERLYNFNYFFLQIVEEVYLEGLAIHKKRDCLNTSWKADSIILHKEIVDHIPNCEIKDVAMVLCMRSIRINFNLNT